MGFYICKGSRTLHKLKIEGERNHMGNILKKLEGSLRAFGYAGYTRLEKRIAFKNNGDFV